MTAYRLPAIPVLSLVLIGAPAVARAQPDPTATIVHIAHTYQVIPNITYRTVSNWDAKLDLYQPRGVNAPQPVVVFFHGGGWTSGTKEGNALAILPYLQMGWTVVNVEYRLTNVALAPAAVEDARCALRWVYRNAREHNFDTTKIVTSGQSAGGHLAMIAAMLPAASPFDNTCPGNRSGGASGTGPRNSDELKVAAIVDWYGISDVHELLGGENLKSYAAAWLGALPYREELARQLSPETYIRPGIPPIISIHGDSDPTVPYSQKRRLHEALDRARLPHELVTISGGKHGGFNDAENMSAYARIRSFLGKYRLAPDAEQTTPQKPAR
jgi:acetyl esterase/lipase